MQTSASSDLVQSYLEQWEPDSNERESRVRKKVSRRKRTGKLGISGRGRRRSVAASFKVGKVRG